ncbi:MAG TPA: helix-turn-helix transcriptional regulator [Thermoanaerobaculia bacterium]|jgi:transcriptional regulator with XRE-family HTH domain|nr:helix-turn-helix transcriptional regulator [Thermoanaerobaculia bacterium]
MKVGQKLIHLRTIEGHARGLGREMTQAEVAKAVREEQKGQLSQSYLSQLESGSRAHMTGNTRLLLARLFKVHPGHLVDDPEDMQIPRVRPRREIYDKLDLWLIEGSEEFADDRQLSDALLKIAKHEHSKECLMFLGSIVQNRHLIDRLLEAFVPPPQPARKKRRA